MNIKQVIDNFLILFGKVIYKVTSGLSLQTTTYLLLMILTHSISFAYSTKVYNMIGLENNKEDKWMKIIIKQILLQTIFIPFAMNIGNKILKII